MDAHGHHVHSRLRLVQLRQDHQRVCQGHLGHGAVCGAQRCLNSSALGFNFATKNPFFWRSSSKPASTMLAYVGL